MVKPRPRDFVSSMRETPLLVILSAPLIYSLIIPFALLDLWVSVYQALCFPVYGVDRVARGSFFQLDRAKLPYLNAVEKLNCQFCAYANGVIGFVREVAARTEQYWCPIKHAEPPTDPHSRYDGFSAYGAGADYAVRRKNLRADLRPASASHTVTPAVRPKRHRPF